MKQINIFFILLILHLFEQISNIITNISKINRKRKLSENRNFITDIYFSEKDENYFIKLYIGDELIPQTYILDTTFPLISSACSLCNNCTKHYFPFYKINNNFINCNSSQCLLINSSYCKENKCYFKKESDFNSNKNIEGFMVNSRIFINNKNTNYNVYYNNIPIGCTIKEGEFYKNKEINGIIGLNNDRNTFIDNLYNLNYIQNNIFTICLSKERGGYFSIGKIVNYNFYFENISYINLLDSSSENNLFELEIDTIQIEKHFINEKVIAYIDSTDNFSYFPKHIFNFILDIIQRKSGTQLFKYNPYNGYCNIINNEDEKNKLYEIFPKIILNFEGYNYEWKSYNYLIENKNEKNEIILCIGFKELIEEKKRIILGTNFMANHDIIFDKKNKRIAFINSNCELKNNSNKEEENNNEKSDLITEDINDKNYNNKVNNNKTNNFKSYLNKEKEYYDISTNNNNKIYDTLYSILGNKSSNINNTNVNNSIITNISENILIDNIKQNNTLIKKVKNSEFKNDLTLSSIINLKKTINNNKTIIISDNNKNINISLIKNNIQTSSINDYIISTQFGDKNYINKTNIFHKKNITEENILKIINSSFILNTSNFKNKFKGTTISKNQEKTTFLYNNITTSINEIFNNNNYNKNTDIINKENKNNISKESTINKDNNKEKSSNRNIFYIFRNFFTNKLIYFLFAILGTILGLLVIIFISCAIISCFKFFKRRNYVEQIDIGLPSGSFSSRS